MDLPRRVDGGFVDTAFDYCVVFARHGAKEEGSQNGENFDGSSRAVGVEEGFVLFVVLTLEIQYDSIEPRMSPTSDGYLDDGRIGGQEK